MGTFMYAVLVSDPEKHIKISTFFFRAVLEIVHIFSDLIVWYGN